MSINNLTIEGFNHGILIDKGSCTLVNVKLVNNSCKYTKEHDWGGGILNMGICACYNCTFINNHAKYGAGIYNQGLLIIDNITIFLKNKAYKSGNEITYVDSASIIFNDIEYKGHGEDLKFNNGTYYIDYHKGFTSAGVKAMLAGSIVSSFASGFITGLLAGNPWLGLVLGGIEGLTIGAVMTMFVLTNNYDYHRGNVNTALLFIGTSVAAGMLGGLIGGLIGQKILQNKMNKEEIKKTDPVEELEKTDPIEELEKTDEVKKFKIDKNFKCNDKNTLRSVEFYSQEDRPLKFANGKAVPFDGKYSPEIMDAEIYYDYKNGKLYTSEGYGILGLNEGSNGMPGPDFSGPV